MTDSRSSPAGAPLTSEGTEGRRFWFLRAPSAVGPRRWGTGFTREVEASLFGSWGGEGDPAGQTSAVPQAFGTTAGPHDGWGRAERGGGGGSVRASLMHRSRRHDPPPRRRRQGPPPGGPLLTDVMRDERGLVLVLHGSGGGVPLTQTAPSPSPRSEASPALGSKNYRKSAQKPQFWTMLIMRVTRGECPTCSGQRRTAKETPPLAFFG